MASTSQPASKRISRAQIVFLILFVAALYVLLPQIGVFKHSFQVLSRAEFYPLLAALFFSMATYFVAAATYYLLSDRKLHYSRTVLVQFASMFTNRLLPAGIGGIGANYAYLKRSKLASAQAASVVAANNLLGLIGHLLLILVAVVLFRKHLVGIHVPSHHLSFQPLDLVVVLVIIVIFIVAGRYHVKAFRAVSNIFKRLLAYRKHPFELKGALLSSMILTLCNVLSLYFCVLALHIALPFIAVLLVFSLGIALGTATPTPGGLGGVEAGLVAGMVAYHVASADALAAVLAYRLISYWLALVIGAGAFVVTERRGYF